MTHYSNTNNPIDFPKWSIIDKLWGKALDRVVPDTYSSLSLTQVEKVKTVFAELIVRECSNFLKDTLDDHFAAEQLEEHFGVEE